MEPLTLADAAQWESWLAANHQLQVGVWLKIAKRGQGQTSVTTEEALQVALCYGWIDSHRRGFDRQYFLQKYSPRRPKGSWSKRNIDNAQALIAAGRLQAPGLTEVQAARADGRWDAAYESQANATVPPDLAVALEHDEGARVAFERLGKSERYTVILRLLKARTPATRASRLEKVITALSS